ncbi:stress response protein-like protein [Halogeometricum pallidum JCM 14848]|uniref:Stress response protein-like protein n=1 Tax=Halogeometricum pallidum JCM 14848 TaxID=1227487 RepID=M0D8T2_HALPD|nr:stress response protein-like protein [Halogeometricum pallidum JCM 14848]
MVPFDGSELAEAALVRAGQFGAVFEEDVLAVSIVPRGNVRYAVDRGWLEPGEPFDLNAVVAALHERVTACCPSADFRHSVVGRYAPPGSISTRIRRMIEDEGATMVFIGSENAGHVVASLSSVGSHVAADESYDVVIVRHGVPSRIAALAADRRKQRRPKSDFFLPE